ncbi:MAG TPA: pyridoxamine 5'-phosphate oxidase family protein [Candidatus Paceibacterota bacterium]|nr:pyridoxamine 5'-phosphate oxidase family protein [Candidatus Paceibacterota bacterium]
MSHTEETALKVEVHNFLDTHRKAVFAFLDAEDKPVTSLMLYMVDEHFNVYFGTRKAFAKYTQAKRQPHISLSVVEERLDPLKVVDIRGVAEELSEAEQESVYADFKLKNTSRYYVEDADDFVMFRIRPQVIRWADATSGELKITEIPVL